MLTPRPRAIVFDMDGVLVLSTLHHASAFADTLAPLGITTFDYAEYAGQRTPDVFRHVLTRHGLAFDEALISRLSEQKSELARQHIAAGDSLAPGCVEVLTRLAAHYPLALASSGSRPSVAAFLAHSGAAALFRSVLSGSDVARAKPDPEIYLASFQQLGLQPADCIVVEDAVSGTLAARAVGARVIGMAQPADAAALLAAGASQVVENLAALATLLLPEPHMTIDSHNWTSFAAPAVDPNHWTVVIPAAGRGSRLGFDKPKILFPVASKPILAWLIDRFAPFASRFVFVLSPDGAPHVTPLLEQLLPGRFEVVPQPVPAGMGDAVARGLDAVQTPAAAIVWGDQVNLRSSSVEAVLRLHQGPLAPLGTVPTVLTAPPYIHFTRHPDGRLSGVLQAREGDAMPAEGESDTGFFCFNAAPLRELLAGLRASGAATGAGTGEFNFLPVIPLADQGPQRVLTPSIVTPIETVGINSRADAARIEAFLESTSQHE